MYFIVCIVICTLYFMFFAVYLCPYQQTPSTNKSLEKPVGFTGDPSQLTPLITKPTRVTRESATLIDHVLTNNFDINSKHVQGILCTSISDHYAIFHVAGNAGITSANDIPVLKRNFT